MKQLNYDIGRRIAQLRERDHMTQEQLSEILGISLKHCSSVERGLSSFSLEKLIQVCEIFDITTDYLILGHEKNDINNIPNLCVELFTHADDQEYQILIDYLTLFKRIREKKK